MKSIAISVVFCSLLVSCMKWDGKKKYYAAGGGVNGQSESAAVPTALRRITKSQFVNTVNAALGSTLAPKTALPDDPTKDDLVAIATRDSVFSLRDAELYNNAGWDIAGQFVDTPNAFSARFDCACGDMTKACLAKGLEPIGKVLFHGDFTDADLYLKLFEDVSSSLTKEMGAATVQQTNCQSVRTVLAAMIGSPRTFYFDNLLDYSGRSANVELKKKFSHSLVNQLAYFLWNSPPDRNLLDLAESGALADEKERLKVIRSMVDDQSRFKAGMKALFDDWLAMRVVEKLATTTNGQAEIAKGALGEYQFLVEKSIESNNFLETFFTSNATILDSNLATVYGVPATSGALSSGDRAGFLTRSAFLLRAGPGATSPTKRGHFIRGHLLCEDIPPPPPNLDLTTGVPKTDNKYEIIKARLVNPSCKGCHAQLDPLGIGLEGYGPNGESVALPDFASYQLSASVYDQPYSGGADLSRLLLKDDKVLSCFAKNAWRIGLGKKESAEEAAEIEKAVDEFQAGSSRALAELMFQLLSHTM